MDFLPWLERSTDEMTPEGGRLRSRGDGSYEKVKMVSGLYESGQTFAKCPRTTALYGNSSAEVTNSERISHVSKLRHSGRNGLIHGSQN
jgi:hypothetical protein